MVMVSKVRDYSNLPGIELIRQDRHPKPKWMYVFNKLYLADVKIGYKLGKNR